MIPYRRAFSLSLAALLLAISAGAAEGQTTCREWTPELRRNPTEAELRCRFGVTGPGRFGLLSYADVPVYQPATPMPGTHLVGVPGHARPAPGESFERWEWRILQTDFRAEARWVFDFLEGLDPLVASRILRFEALLEEAGVRATRRETWRDPARQAHLFQQGRSRPGPLATATLTSWHSQVDEHGNPASRAVDYHVPWAQLETFHDLARSVGLETFGADSHDPGHVFVPDPEALTPEDLMLLRVLPRVPVVTLATGLPMDRPLPAGGTAELRERVMRFVGEPFLPHVEPSLAGAVLSPEIVPAISREAGATVGPAAAGDGRGARPRAGAY